MPLYFAFSGLRTDFGLIDSGEAVSCGLLGIDFIQQLDSTASVQVGISIFLIVAATLSKILGIWLPAYKLKLPTRISLMLGVLMSCKGLIALIVVNYGISYKIITPKLFAIIYSYLDGTCDHYADCPAHVAGRPTPHVPLSQRPNCVHGKMPCTRRPRPPRMPPRIVRPYLDLGPQLCAASTRLLGKESQTPLFRPRSRPMKVLRRLPTESTWGR